MASLNKTNFTLLYFNSTRTAYVYLLWVVVVLWVFLCVFLVFVFVCFGVLRFVVCCVYLFFVVVGVGFLGVFVCCCCPIRFQYVIAVHPRQMIKG